MDAFIIFELDGAAYAIRSTAVQHVDMVGQITSVPNAAPAVDGVAFSRGNVVPVINLRARFGLPRQPVTPSSRLLFLRVKDRVVALLVDSAREFRSIPGEEIRPIESQLVGIQGNYVEGVVTVKGRSVLIVDVGAVLTLEEITLPEPAA